MLVGDLLVTTTIPRSVGLAGSSAILISGLHALAAHVGVELSADTVARMAHTIERADLEIAGGWHDQSDAFVTHMRRADLEIVTWDAT